MNFALESRLLSWLLQANPQIWILASGRFLTETDTGFTLFDA